MTKGRRVSGKHFTDWLVEAEKRGVTNFKIREVNKTANYRRMVNAGFPVYSSLMDIPYCDFNLKNKRLKEFLEKYKQFFVRVKPDSEHTYLQKRPLIGVRDWQEIKDFVKSVVGKNGDFYFVDISEHVDETWSGIIISRIDRIIVEVLEGGLDALCHGEQNPTLSCCINLEGYGPLETRTGWWGERSRTGKRLVDYALKWLRIGGNDFHPVFYKGYFEFLKRADKRGMKSIVFFDWIKESSYIA